MDNRSSGDLPPSPVPEVVTLDSDEDLEVVHEVLHAPEREVERVGDPGIEIVNELPPARGSSGEWQDGRVSRSGAGTLFIAGFGELQNFNEDIFGGAEEESSRRRRVNPVRFLFQGPSNEETRDNEVGRLSQRRRRGNEIEERAEDNGMSTQPSGADSGDQGEVCGEEGDDEQKENDDGDNESLLSIRSGGMIPQMEPTFSSDCSDTEVDLTIPPPDSDEEEEEEEVTATGGIGEDSTKAALQLENTGKTSNSLEEDVESNADVGMTIPSATDKEADSQLDDSGIDPTMPPEVDQEDSELVEGRGVEVTSEMSGESFVGEPIADQVSSMNEQDVVCEVQEMMGDISLETSSSKEEKATADEMSTKKEESRMHEEVEGASGGDPQVSPGNAAAAASAESAESEDNPGKKRKEIRVTYVRSKPDLNSMSRAELKRLKEAIQNRVVELNSQCDFKNYKQINTPANARVRPGSLYPDAYDEQDEAGRKYVNHFRPEHLRELDEHAKLTKNLTHIKLPSGPTPSYLEVMGCNLPRGAIPERFRTLSPPEPPSPKNE